MTQKPRKHVPSSRVIEIHPSNSGKAEGFVISEDYPTEKDEIEQIIADKFVIHLNTMRNTNYVCHKSEHPDFICIYNTREIALELMELVPRSVSLRKYSLVYTTALKERMGNQDFNMEFSCPQRIDLPKPNSKQGKALIREIQKNILQVESESEEIHPEDCSESLIPRDACRLLDSKCIRANYPVLSIYYSLVGPVLGGISYSLTDEDYKEIREKFSEKLQKDYSTSENCEIILLLYGFESARPDTARLAKIISQLMNTSRYHFSEVWYIRPYPNANDDIRMIYRKSD